MSRSYAIAKRISDLAAVVLGLGLIWPVLIVLYFLARRSTGGSGLYRQDRAGREGKIFRMVKLRTMRADHVHDIKEVVRLAHPNITHLGRFLRRTKIAELPQLFNVLIGDMSLVGPRPTVPEQVAEYDDFKRRRLAAPPGITGLAQINGGTDLTWDERIEWDVYYVERRSLWMDLKILLATLWPGKARPARRLHEVHPEAAAALDRPAAD